MTFSRYAGPGSHRYPVGFSGDTVVSWESLRFQPYFTSTASNIGYGWWSHDIGGHMNGYKDDELEGRWYQLGVFSPINRLHSTKSEFTGKEPWRYKQEIRVMMNNFLKLRYRLLPYLYSMNYRAYREDIPMILPVYYIDPQNQEAYEVQNEYCFGSEMIVMPVTSPCISHLNRAKEKVWLPEGQFFDFFSGMRYDGGRTIWMYRDMESLPVLAKAGAIIPMQENFDIQNPEKIILRIYAGADGKFVLYEDDNESCAYEKGIFVTTQIRLEWQKQRVVIEPAEGNVELIPDKRDYVVEIYGCKENYAVCTVNGRTVSNSSVYSEEKHCIKIELLQIASADRVILTFGDRLELIENDVVKLIFDFLCQAEIEFSQKSRIYDAVKSRRSASWILSRMQTMDLPDDLYMSISEILTAHE